MYPEFLLSADERKAFATDRTGAIAGRGSPSCTAGRSVTRSRCAARSTRARGRSRCAASTTAPTSGTDQSTFFFHFDYLNEAIKKIYPRRGDQTGVFIVQLKDPQQAAEVSEAIDATFRNSLAETLTETEKAFQLGFVAMTETILLAIQAVSFVVIVIIMAVMANTMAMTARERYTSTRR